MNLQEITQFIEDNYQPPVLKTWQPSEYDMKYRYNTPRKLKKLESDKAKEDAKLRIIFDKETESRVKVFRTIIQLDSFPQSISSLFYSTIKWQVEDDKKLKEEFAKLKNELKTKYQPEIFSSLDYYSYNMSKIVYDYKKKLVELLKHWSFDKRFKEWIDTITTDEFAQSIVSDFKYYSSLKSHVQASPGPIGIIQWGCSRLEDICESIVNVMGGIPTGIETDPHWGIDGNFNGIIFKDEKRASFKSFVAGGWNIQRRHIRFRIILLKGN